MKYRKALEGLTSKMQRKGQARDQGEQTNRLTMRENPYVLYKCPDWSWEGCICEACVILRSQIQ